VNSFRQFNLAWLLLLGWAVSCMSQIGAHAQVPLESQQGWSGEERGKWYEATQGSRLIPYAWMQSLEQAPGEDLFLDDANLERFRFLPYTTSRGLRLPVGFALDDTPDDELTFSRLRWFAGQGEEERWVGFNCSACHTAEMRHADQTIRVDGGPALIDFQGFMTELDAALQKTRDDPGKWDRFAARVLGGRDDAANRALLKGAFAQFVAYREREARMNAVSIRYGFGRLDAFGHIFNKVALVAAPEAATANAPDAPVSIPFLWNIHQHDRVQWNGIAQNLGRRLWPSGETFDIGALARNTGEVIGVFADVKAEKGLVASYASSIQVGSLDAIERQLTRLQPPAWPQEFPQPDASRVATGRDLFGRACAGCHEVLARDDLETRFEAKMGFFREGLDDNVPPGTDPWMACNAYTYAARAGLLEGTLSAGGRIGETEPVSTLLGTMVTGTLVRKRGDIVAAATQAFFGTTRPPRVVDPSPDPTIALAEAEDRPERLRRCMTEDSNVLGYKARPLTGIWATAPFLHNGSVPTLHDLLLPPAERPRAFRIGTRIFDPDLVGYRTDEVAGNDFVFRTHDDDGAPVPGNSNLGHDYGNAGFSDADRKALVEYMKTL